MPLSHIRVGYQTTLSKLVERTVVGCIRIFVDQINSFRDYTVALVAESADPCQSLLSITSSREELANHEHEPLAVTSVVNPAHHFFFPDQHYRVVSLLVDQVVQR